MSFGYEEGEVCGRNGCKGIIRDKPVENCSCHISPPCHACTEDRAYCDECDYEGKNNEHMNGFIGNVDKSTGIWKSFERRQLDASKIDWHSLSHTHFSMIKEGVYPEGTTRDQVLDLVKGTFGGRFEYFGNGKFKYIAYTD